MALASACGRGGDEGEGDSAVAPGDGESVPASRCPGLEPRAGARCVVPEGTTCLFGACRATAGRCRLGRWELSALDRGGAECPELPPAAGSPCPECWSPSAVCTYGADQCTADGSANPTAASCPAESWVVTVLTCDGGASDGGDDAGGDGDSDDAGIE